MKPCTSVIAVLCATGAQGGGLARALLAEHAGRIPVAPAPQAA